MSHLIPLVTPSNESQGIAVGTSPTAIFEKSIDEGSINTSSCFLVEISRRTGDSLDDYLANTGSAIEDVVPGIVTSERINLADEDLYTAPDYGTDPNSGELYRTKVIINPDNLLKPNTNYAVLLSKDITPVTVFDAEANAGNAGTGSLFTKGVNTGLIADTYTLTVTKAGSKNTAEFAWARSSDSYTSVSIQARGRYTEIDQGVTVKFDDGAYEVGDSFVIRVIAADFQDEIYSWTFSTGSGEYELPTDERSSSVVSLPVEGETVLQDDFYVVSVDPPNAESLVKIARKASVVVDDIIFRTIGYTASFNSYTVEFLGGGTAGSETVDLVDSTKIQITIEDDVSTAQQIIDAFSAHALSASIETETDNASAQKSVTAAKQFSTGVDANTITITFNKDIDETSLTDKIKVLSESICPAGSPTEVLFDTSVSGAQLTITLKEG
jgi:hypothetical protein